MKPVADMRGRRCVITGATSGIGEATARALARAGAELTLVCRSPEKAEATCDRIRASAPGARLDVVLADLASQAEVRRAATLLLADPRPIHVLLNNAAVVNLRHTTTLDGIETTFAVNHLAYFLLTRLLLDRVLGSADASGPAARIVNVASDAHKFSRMHFDDLGQVSSFRWMRVYGQSKLANILFTRELARRIAGRRATANALHPGGVSTGLGANNGALLHRVLMTLGRPFLKSPEAGAATSIYLASAPEVEGTSGEYFAKCRRVPGSAESRDPEVAQRLWDVSEQMTGLS
jgi:NAD(P)-dependent dehydrogenase (short-subunit alcohol dehydrogenase family)